MYLLQQQNTGNIAAHAKRNGQKAAVKHTIYAEWNKIAVPLWGKTENRNMHI